MPTIRRAAIVFLMLSTIASKAAVAASPVHSMGCSADAEGAHRTNPSSQAKPNSRIVGGGRYCGVQCLFSLLRSLGESKVDFASLVKPKYIGSRSGSSLKELETAARDAGMHAVSLMHLSGSVICEAGCPAVLHVKSDVASPDYDHWVLFLGTNGGQARIIDPPRGLENIPFDQLCAKWDGAALLVSREPVDVGHLYISGALQIAALAALGIFVVLGLSCVDSFSTRRSSICSLRRPFAARLALQVAILCAASCLFAVVARSASPGRFLGDDARLQAIKAAHAADFLPRVTAGDVPSLCARRAVFLDARFVPDYKAGHIEGAINVPPGTAASRIVDHLKSGKVAEAEEPEEREIVVYCQSGSCPFAGQVATALTQLGYKNVAILDGGWVELESWKRRTGPGGE